eukprot:UN03599
MGGGGGTMSEYKLTLSTKKIVITGRRANKKIVLKHNMDSSIYVAAHSDSSTGFSVYLLGMWVNCGAPNRHIRDVLLALTRLFIQQARINDVSTESEKYREKQYSSSWMLSLINAEHDMVLSMPKCSKVSSDQIASNIQDNNIGEILLQSKLANCSPRPDDLLVDALHQPFETFYQFVTGALDSNTTQDNIDQHEPTHNKMWVTRADFERNATSETQLATLDLALSHQQRPRFETKVNNERPQSSSLANDISLNNNNNNNPSIEKTHVAKPQYVEEYVPYDIDDVTPQLGQGKRGFDDIIVSPDSDDEDTTPKAVNPGHAGSEAGHDNSFHAPAIIVNIKKADEVVVDNDANKLKIQQIFQQPAAQPLPPAGAGGRRRK